MLRVFQVLPSLGQRGHFLNMPFGAIFLDKTLPLPQLVPDGAGEEEEGGEPPCLKLECVASWRLFGWVQSIASVRLAGADRDSLLLAFKNAKLSLVVCTFHPHYPHHHYPHPLG